MARFEIWENDTRFATIEARNGVSALRKASREYPRRRCDYNMEADDKPFTVTWRACKPNESWTASAEIIVPGRSDHGCSFHSKSEALREARTSRPLADSPAYYADLLKRCGG
jgi:hypothetical protein